MPRRSSGGIWLSYRREDTESWAHMLVDELREVLLAEDASSMDLYLKPGQNRSRAIREEVGTCAVLLALIGRQWATVTDRSGHRLIDNPDDQVRLEIQTAFERGVPVIPVLFDSADLPRQQELPSKLHKLAGLNAFVLNMNDAAQFEQNYSQMQQLVNLVEPVFAEQVYGEGPDVSQAAAKDPSTTPRVTRWLRGARAREGRSVFISYRRKLSEHLARSVNNDLIKHRFDTFVDLKNLDSGDFERVILSQIEAREHFIVLLQPGSLDQIGEDGDWLRREIAHALAHRRNVVPVTADGFEFRRDLVLPPDVAKLPSLNAVTIPPVYFDAAMGLLRTRFLKMPSNP
jgi:hypothetical protein